MSSSSSSYNDNDSQRRYEEIIIEHEQALTADGWTAYWIPRNETVDQMIIYNDDAKKVLYRKFYRSDLKKTVKAVKEATKELLDKYLIDKHIQKKLVKHFE